MGESLFEPPLQLYWTWLLQWIPLWMAPNTITLIGLAINLVTTLVLIFYCPTVTEEVGLAARWYCSLEPPLGLLRRRLHYRRQWSGETLRSGASSRSPSRREVRTRPDCCPLAVFIFSLPGAPRDCRTTTPIL